MKRHRTAAAAMRNTGRAKVLQVAAPLPVAVPSYLSEVVGFRQRHALKTADGFRSQPSPHPVRSVPCCQTRSNRPR
jgi:hypothetical protein